MRTANLVTILTTGVAVVVAAPAGALTASIGQLGGTGSACLPLVDFVQSASSVQSVARVGRPSVAHATATGKVLLAFGTAEPAPGPLTVYTKRTITDRRKLDAELDRVRTWLGGTAASMVSCRCSRMRPC